MNKSLLLTTLGQLAFLAANKLLAQSPEKLNVLFLAVDDLKPESGCYGKL